MADAQILVAGTSAIPVSYEVPNAVEEALLCVNATIDGTGASGSFLAAVEIISDGGVVVARCPCFTTIASGGTAEISWFRLRNPTAVASASTIYHQVVLNTPNIRSLWTLDEASGVTFADSGPANVPLAIIGPPTLGTAPLITSGASATFSGGTDGLGRAQQYGQATTGYGNWPAPGSLTVEAWIKTSFGGGTDPEIVGMDDNTLRLFQFRLEPAGRLQLITFNAAGTVATTATGATVINDGARHYIVGTFNGNTGVLKVYVDAVLDGTNTALSAYTGNTPKPTIAARLVGGITDTPIGGVIDEVAIYSRDLTATEVTQHHNAGLA